MQKKTTCRIHWMVLSALLGIATLLGDATAAWASTRIGNAELQMWYRTRNTFHSNGGDDLNWVQWRNEIYFWFIYDKFVDNGKILGQDQTRDSFSKERHVNLRYRFRADPVWTIRKSFKNQYDHHERQSYLFPENGFRDAVLRLRLWSSRRGQLSARVGGNRSCGVNRTSTAQLT